MFQADKIKSKYSYLYTFTILIFCLSLSCSIAKIGKREHITGKKSIIIASSHYIAGFLLGIFFRGGGQNLLLCKFQFLFYCFRTKFQGGVKVFRMANCLRGVPPTPLCGRKPALHTGIAFLTLHCIKGNKYS